MMLPSFIAGLLLGACLTGVLAYLAFLTFKSQSQNKLQSLQSELETHKKLQDRLQNDFKAAASEALSQANEQFLSSAIKDLRLAKQEADSSLDEKKNSIGNFVAEMKSKLEDYQKTVKRFEEERFSMYAKMEQSLSQVLSAEQAIRMETNSLKRVLTSSAGVRGKWGEKILQEILEQNNFIKGINYETQVSASADGFSDVRPDFVINLAGGKKLIVDCKEVISEYVQAQETEDVENQRAHYEKLVDNIRTNFIKLSRKEYQSVLDPDIPFVVMFIPSEAAIRAAFATDSSLFEEATSKKVILASPMTIIPLIYLIKHGWQQQELANNARELGVAVEELGNRLYKFQEHLLSLRGGIKKTVESWDKAVGSWQTRVSPQIEKTKNLGGRLKDAENLEAIDSGVRLIQEDT